LHFRLTDNIRLMFIYKGTSTHCRTPTDTLLSDVNIIMTIKKKNHGGGNFPKHVLSFFETPTCFGLFRDAPTCFGIFSRPPIRLGIFWGPHFFRHFLPHGIALTKNNGNFSNKSRSEDFSWPSTKKRTTIIHVHDRHEKHYTIYFSKFTVYIFGSFISLAYSYFNIFQFIWKSLKKVLGTHNTVGKLFLVFVTQTKNLFFKPELWNHAGTKKKLFCFSCYQWLELEALMLATTAVRGCNALCF